MALNYDNYLYRLVSVSFCLLMCLYNHQSFSATVNQADTTEILDMLKHAGKLLSDNKITEAEDSYKKAGKLALDIKFDRGFLEYTGKYTGFLYRQLRYAEALEISRQQLSLSLKNGNKQKAADAYNNMAVQYQEMGKLSEAAESFLKALKVSESLNDNENQQKYYTNLSSLFYNLNDGEKSLYYAKKGHDIAVRMQKQDRIGKSLINLSLSEVISGKQEYAIKHLREALAIGEHLRDIDLILTTYINLGDIYNRQNRYKDGLNMFLKAHGYLKEAPPDYEIYVFHGLSLSYKNLGQYKKAALFFDKNIKDAEGQFPLSELSEMYLLGSELKEHLNDYQSALNFRKKHHAFRDSITSNETRSAIHEMEIKYQTSLKEKAIAQQSLQISNQKNELERKNKWIAVLGLGSLVICLAGLIVYILHRQKSRILESRKTAELLLARLKGEEEERARTARELHDGVASMLTAAKMHLGNWEPVLRGEDVLFQEKAISLIEDAVQEVRDISHNLAPEIVLNEGLEYALKDYCSRIAHDRLELSCYVIGEIPILRETEQVLIYRMVQEVISNMIKHSEASQGIVQLTVYENQMSIAIEDNGIGFELSEAKKKGIGLENLFARAALLNARCEINSASGKGSTIFFELDISQYFADDNTTVNGKALTFS